MFFQPADSISSTPPASWTDEELAQALACAETDGRVLKILRESIVEQSVRRLVGHQLLTAEDMGPLASVLPKVEKAMRFLIEE